MNGTAWIVQVDDGNVCCPALMFLGVFSSMEAANRFVEARIRHQAGNGWPDARGYYQVDEFVVDREFDPENDD